MNSKTAKLINKVSKITGMPNSKTIKRLWHDMSDDERYEWRQELKSIIEQDTNDE